MSNNSPIHSSSSVLLRHFAHPQITTCIFTSGLCDVHVIHIGNNNLLLLNYQTVGEEGVAACGASHINAGYIISTFDGPNDWQNVELSLGKEQNGAEIQQPEVACGDLINPFQPNCDPLSFMLNYLVNNRKLQLASSSDDWVNKQLFLQPKDKQTSRVASVKVCKQPGATPLAFIESINCHRHSTVYRSRVILGS